MSAPTQPPSAPAAPGARSTRRVKLERMWVVGVVLFTLARGLLVWGTLGTERVNIWVFAFIDLATAVPYGLSTARLAQSIVDRRGTAMFRWLMVAAGSFLAPYLYVAFASRNLPAVVYYVLGILVVAFGGNAILSVRKKVTAMSASSAPE